MFLINNFRSTFGRVGELMDQKPGVGDVAYLQQNNRYIYYLITKERSFKKPTYESLTAAILKLRDFIVEHGVKKLAIPRIGCGLDKLKWSQVQSIIKNKFKDVECLIKICHFSEVCLIQFLGQFISVTEIEATRGYLAHLKLKPKSQILCFI